MNRIFYLPVILLISILLYSCEDVVDLDLPDNEPALIVDGSITNLSERHYISLKQTISYDNQGGYPVVSDALIILYENNTPVDTLQEQLESPGTYFTDFTASISNLYNIKISLSNGRQYASIPEILSPVSPIDSIYSKFVEESIFNEEGYYVFINTFETPGKGDNYRWRTYINGEVLNKPEDLFFAEDDQVDGNPINELQMHNDPVEPQDTVVVRQMSISKNYYDFLSVLQEQTVFVGGPFDPPPAPIKGNIQNLNDDSENPQGYFYVAGADSDTTIVQP